DEAQAEENVPDGESGSEGNALAEESGQSRRQLRIARREAAVCLQDSECQGGPLEPRQTAIERRANREHRKKQIEQRAEHPVEDHAEYTSEGEQRGAEVIGRGKTGRSDK